MRNLLLSLLAALATTSLVSVHHADACGGNLEPQIYRLSTHFIVGADQAERRRTFALLNEKAPAKGLAWRQLSPMSYDATQIAAGESFTSPVMLTLVGPSGTKVVSSSKHVFLSRSWDFDAATGAVEVPSGDDFAIALSGSHADATWLRLDDVKRRSPSLLSWVTAQGVTPSDADSLYVSHVTGTYVDTITLFPKDGTKMITLVRKGNTLIGRFDGSPTGAFEVEGTTKLVVVDGARVTTVWI
jgi:hypothetical protein